MAFLTSFHSGMSNHIVMGGLISDSFEAKVSVKQGCVLAAVSLDVYLAGITLLAR